MMENKERKDLMKDSRKKSLSEAFINSFGAYPIGYGIGILILPISLGWLQEDPLLANVFITLTYATVSFVRVYFLRRLFIKLGFDDNFIKLAIKLCQRGASIIKSKEWRLGIENPFKTLLF